MSYRPQLIINEDNDLTLIATDDRDIVARPDAAGTVTIYDGTDVWAGWVADDPPAQPAVDTALGAAASARARELTIVTTGFVVGGLYSLKNHYGIREPVVVRGLSSSLGKIQTLDPIHEDQTTASRLQDPRLIVSLLAADLAEVKRGLRAVFTYAIDGVTVRRSVYFDVVRQQWQIPLSEDDIERHWPGWGALCRTPARHTQLVQGARSELYRIVRQWGTYPDLLRDPSESSDALCYLAIRAALSSPNSGADPGDITTIESRLSAALSALHGSGWIDSDDDLVLDEDSSLDGDSGETGPRIPWLRVI